MIRPVMHVPTVRGALLLTVLLVSGLLTVLLPGSSVGAPVSVSPDVARLPAGAMPRLPYVDWPARRIVDGSRRVSISGIQARVVSLHKVDGGYLLGRQLATNPNAQALDTGTHDLVFVSTNGARRSIVSGWQAPRRAELGPDLSVSQNGDKVIVNTERYTGWTATYVDTRVLSLPGGKVLHQRDFGADAPALLGYGVDRAMLNVGSDTVWWNPSTDAVATLRANASGESADLDAWQWAVRPRDSNYAVQGIPPAASPLWPVEPEDVRLGPWSLNGAMLAGNSEVTDEHYEAHAYSVFRASDGEVLLGVVGNQDPQITWESDSALLLRTRIEGTETYQLIRCTLGGSCHRVGPSTSDRRGVIIPASRRNS